METKRSFVTLDGLRGIAALAIITRHAPAYFSSIEIYVQPGGLFFESYLAVDFFFALSGFVLAHAYGHRFCEGLSALQFMKIRLIRLYPLYFFALAIIAVTVFALVVSGELAHGAFSLLSFCKNFIFALLFLPSPSLSSGSAYLFPLNGPAWSLFFELVANFFFGFVGRSLGRVTLILMVVVAGLILAVAVATGTFGFETTEGGAMNVGFEWRSFGAGCLLVTYSFFAGVLVYRFWCAWHPPINVPPLVVVVSMVAILGSHPPDRFQAIFDLVAAIFAFPFLIWVGASSVASGITARTFTWLGTASYAVYVLQAPLYIFTLSLLGKAAQGADRGHMHWSLAFVFVAFVFAVAIVADRYFDRPVRTMLTARLAVRNLSEHTAQSHDRSVPLARTKSSSASQ